MRTITISASGPPTITSIPTPVPSSGFTLVRIHAFGINHAESEIPTPGIECVGTIASCPGCKGGQFRVGLPVASITSGLGQTQSSTYAEYTIVPVGNIVPLVHVDDWEGMEGGGERDMERKWEEEMGMSWSEVAALPVSDVPLREVVRAVADGKFEAKPSKVFKFEEIHEVHRYMEEGVVKGKMVVVVD
ncbi:hypothetical protein B0T16DRAFT_460765 [Cercophora newfieldiana]|uniref:Alcohol dehydrogenase n=1 Tax=Cercophora newfieldiana TaxID=92897 RepID=A0AA39XUR5_9PEZI|nr:hypothetical protein B0T16DRAFT_460765 [Cercophora newfieldiana]